MKSSDYILLVNLDTRAYYSLAISNQPVLIRLDLSHQTTVFPSRLPTYPCTKFWKNRINFTVPDIISSRDNLKCLEPKSILYSFNLNNFSYINLLLPLHFPNNVNKRVLTAASSLPCANIQSYHSTIFQPEIASSNLSVTEVASSTLSGGGVLTNIGV